MQTLNHHKARGFWTQLKAATGLELTPTSKGPGRDSELEQSVLAALESRGLTRKSFRTLDNCLANDANLPEPLISTELLLVALLESQRDFAVMMRDLLDTLILADARTPETALQVEFQFDEVSDPIRATLEEFREAIERIERVLESRPAIANQNQLWKFTNELIEIADRWQRYDVRTIAPLRPFVSSGNTALDQVLQQVLQLVAVHKEWILRHGATRSEVFQAVSARGNPGVEKGGLDWAIAATDYWDLSTEDAVIDIASNARGVKLDAVDVAQRIKLLLEALPRADVWVEKTTLEFLNILNLPIWKKRYEMYSVWVGSVLLRCAANADPRIRFHTQNGVLSFGFAGNLLATYRWGEQDLHIWCELASPLKGKSEKRTRSIKPDFRVLEATESPDPAADTRLVLECKHYLAAGRRNFVSAAADYARSCPKAIAVLANHGPADHSKLIDAVDGKLRDRVRFLGDATAIAEQASQKIATVMVKILFPLEVVQLEISQVDESLHESLAWIQLNWLPPLQDIDLSLWVPDGEGVMQKCVAYDSLGFTDRPPFAQLRNDVRETPDQNRRAEETIDIYRWHYDRYEIRVTNFTGTPGLTSERVQCVLNLDGTEPTVLLPPDDCGPVWRVATLVVRDGRLCVERFDEAHARVT